MSEINWKNKYEALRAKFMESVDTAFRLGYEQGSQEAQMQAMQDQAAAQAEQEAAMQGQPGQEGDDQQQPEEQAPPDSTHPGGSELDQHITELESMLGKSEIDMNSLMKTVAGFRKLQKDIQLKSDLKKSYQAISGIAKAMHKPKFKIGVQANANLTSSAKKAVNMQQDIVTDIMKSWDEEKVKVGTDITTILKSQGIIKG